MHCNCGFMLSLNWMRVCLFPKEDWKSLLVLYCVYIHTENFCYNYLSCIETQVSGGWECATFFPTPPPLSWIYPTKDRYCSHSSPVWKLFVCLSVFLQTTCSVFIHPSLSGLLFSFHVSSFLTLSSAGPPADGASRSNSQTDWENWSVKTQPHWSRLQFIELLKHATVVATQPSFFFLHACQDQLTDHMVIKLVRCIDTL